MQKLVLIGISIVLLSSCRVMQPNKMFQVPDDYQYSEFKSSKKFKALISKDSFDKKIEDSLRNHKIFLVICFIFFYRMLGMFTIKIEI